MRSSVVLAWLALASSGSAQAAPAQDEAERTETRVVSRAVAPTPAQRERLQGLLDDYLRQRGLSPARTWDDDAGEPWVPAAALAALGETEKAVRTARRLSGRFEEGAALRALVDAEQALLGVLSVPEVHAFLAELYLQAGVCAAQLGEVELASTYFERASSLDPGRTLRAAEAPPATLSLAGQVAKRVESTGDSETPLAVTPDAFRVWIDGREVQGQSKALRAKAGVHVLVVRATGHAPYASLVRLEPGRRPVMRIALSPTPEHQLQERLHEASSAAGALMAGEALARAGVAEVWLATTGEERRDRALVYRCGAKGDCRPQVSLALDGGRVLKLEDARAAVMALRPSPEASAQRRESRHAWKRWPLWVSAIGVGVAGAVVAAVWASRDHGIREERLLVVEPSAPSALQAPVSFSTWQR